MSRNPGYVQGWLDYIRNVEEIDPVVYLCNIGLDSPAADRSITITFEEWEIVDTVNKSYHGNAIETDYKGGTFKTFVHPIDDGKWEGEFIVPCYADHTLGPIKIINMMQSNCQPNSSCSDFNTIKGNP